MSHNQDKTIKQAGNYEVYCKGEHTKSLFLNAGTMVHREKKGVLVFYDPKTSEIISRIAGINPAFKLCQDS